MKLGVVDVDIDTMLALKRMKRSQCEVCGRTKKAATVLYAFWPTPSGPDACTKCHGFGGPLVEATTAEAIAAADSEIARLQRLKTELTYAERLQEEYAE